MNRVTAIVLAAGAGRRIGGDLSKTYLPVAGRPLVLRTLDRMFSSTLIEQVILVIGAADLERCTAMLRIDSALQNRSWTLQTGGATRQQSAKRGLEKITPDADLVVIHDGARPFASTELIDRCIDAAAIHGAAVPGLPARDTIKVVSEEHWIENTPDRNTLWEIQTPQVFQRELIVAAHEQAAKEDAEFTDDAMVVERFGKRVFVVQGERTNIKITVPEDLWFAETLIRQGRVP
jgi:2-C-methyl-D-erythritol 4-phosphate cytidylyltransferase